VDGTIVSLQVPAKGFADNPHRYVACVDCHTDVARSPHRTETGGQCRSCHPVHGEGTARSPHLQVDCQACHYPSEFVQRDGADNRVKLSRKDAEDRPIGLVNHGLKDLSDKDACRRCHNADNTVGAAAAVLPAKSALCVMCHPSPMAVGHPIFWIALLALAFGLLLMVRFWFIGKVREEADSLHRKISLSADAVWQTLFSKKIFTVARVMVFDILLQRRILKESVQRWSMHSLIFLAIVLRLGLSLFTGLLFSVDPDGQLSLALIDKNNMYTAMIYDFTGLCILIGAAWALVQRFVVKPAHVVTEIEDNITVGLVGALAAAGFLTTGARLLLTQVPPEIAVYSFIGYPVSRVLGMLPIDWRSAYPVLWYVHAVLGAAFVAYLPFGKLRHIFNVPLTYLIEEIYGVKRGERV
jgi:nitrate reductase gamma subunit